MLTSSTTHVRVATIGIYIYALSTVAGGLFDLIWGEFEAAHQPIGALGDHIPGQTLLAYVTAIAMIAGGLALLWRRTARAGSLVTAFIYFAFALFWLPRFYTGPHLL